MTNRVLIKRSGTPASIPAAGDLQAGELAINYADGNLFYKNSSNVVTVIASNQFVSVSGNITGGNLNATGLSLSGNVVSVLQSTANITTTGNIQANYFVGNGSQLTGITVAAGTSILNGNSNVSVGANGNVTVGVTGVSNVAVFTPTGVEITGTVSSSGNITGSNIGTAGLINATGNITGGNLRTTGLISAVGNVTGNYFLGNGSLLTGIITSVANINNGNSNVDIAASAANITVSVSGIGNVVVFAPTGQYVSGEVSASGNVTGSNIVTSGLASATGNITGGNLLTSGLVSATGNITGGNVNATGLSLSGNVVSALNVTSNVAAGNITSPGLISATGNITGGNLLTAGLVSATGNVTGGNINTAGGVSATGTVTSTSLTVGGTVSFNSSINTITIAANQTSGLIRIGGSGAATGLITLGQSAANQTVDIANGVVGSGNVKTVNIGGNGAANSTSNVNLFNSMAGNAFLYIGGNGTAATGNTTVSFQANTIVQVANTGGSALSVAGNITGGNLTTAASVSAASVSASGNVTGGNILTAGIMSSTGNATAANVNTAGLISATGNVTGGNVIGTTAVIVPTLRNTANLAISATGNINLQPTANIVVNNTYINGVQLNPVQDQDVATKYYVDTMISSGIAYHSPVTAATTDTLANITGGTVSYTQPNGAGNGIGALLTTTGSFNLIDTANVQTIGTRILVKDQANAVQNGVYTWANATNIVRSTDTDEYGPNSVEQLSVNDYFFVQSGNVNKGSAFVVNSPTGTITFGTSNITFTTFSTSQAYTANTAAGISLAGTVINAKTDGITTAFDGGGNIIVKASANLTTPNIGAATGTSLSVTGNITGGNLNAAGLSLSSNVVSALNSTANITTSANVSANYFLGNGSQLTGISVSSTKISNGTSEANIGTSGGNANISIGGTSNVAVFTTSGLNITGNISASGNVSSGIFYGGGNLGLDTEAVTATFNFGNVTQATDLIYLLGVVTAPNDAVNGTNIIDYTITSSKLANSIVLTTPNIGAATGTSLSVLGNVNAASLTGTTVSVSGTVSADRVTTVSVPQVLNDISNQCDGAKMVFALQVDTSNITSANITDSKNLQVAVNGLVLSPWVNTQTWPWFQTFAGFPTASPGYRVTADSTSANITFYRSPAQGSQVVLTIINNSSTSQLRKYPYSATTIVLGD